ncbi:MAG: thiamine pyrophosphate-binding protein, partial [Dehalococcoidales bacterium]|nr:thiamine pyrophosphate-binding protein [Dehalococcoidales bacterium]
MGKIHGGQLAVNIFKKEGVKYVFELCGGHIDPISQACLDAGIKIIDTRHEMNAAFAADGWARATGKPTVAMATAGPGVTNATTGIWNAYGCRSPMVFFGGKHPLSEYDIGSLQDMDSMALEEGITKWRRACYETRRIPEYFGMAFRQATEGQPGPVFLESPWDILGGEIDEEKAVKMENYRTTA